MTKLIVMFIMVGVQPTTIPGWNSIDACNSAKAGVETVLKEKHGASSYVTVDAQCAEFPNNSQGE